MEPGRPPTRGPGPALPGRGFSCEGRNKGRGGGGKEGEGKTRRKTGAGAVGQNQPRAPFLIFLRASGRAWGPLHKRGKKNEKNRAFIGRVGKRTNPGAGKGRGAGPESPRPAPPAERGPTPGKPRGPTGQPPRPVGPRPGAGGTRSTREKGPGSYGRVRGDVWNGVIFTGARVQILAPFQLGGMAR